MTQPHSIVKIAVIASSVLLAGGAIAYRAGAFDRFLRSDTPQPTQPAPTIMPSSKYKSFIDPAMPTTPDAQPPLTPQEREIMSSSKSIILTRPAQPAAQPAPTILPGSKSDAIFLPGSKSAPLITPPAPPPPANSQPTPPSK